MCSGPALFFSDTRGPGHCRQNPIGLSCARRNSRDGTTSNLSHNPWSIEIGILLLLSLRIVVVAHLIWLSFLFSPPPPPPFLCSICFIPPVQQRERERKRRGVKKIKNNMVGSIRSTPPQLFRAPCRAPSSRPIDSPGDEQRAPPLSHKMTPSPTLVFSTQSDSFYLSLSVLVAHINNTHST